MTRVREFIDRIEVSPAADTKKPADLMVYGRLAELMKMSSGPLSPEGIAGCGDRI